jgi:aminoglycoside phosphotransferase (APT) family kinase protein
MTVFAEDQKFEQLVQKLAPQSKLLRTWSLKGGISAAMTALEIERPDRQTSRMIVRRPGDATLKRNPRAAEDEFKLLQLAQSLGLATQRPYYLDQAGAVFSTPCLVIEYIEGQPEFAPADLTDFIPQVATQLARIHSVDCTNQDLSFVPRQANGFAATFGPQPAQLNESLDEGRIRDTLVAVIDWEDAKLGDPLIDFAVSRLDILWIFGLDAFRSFTRRYESMMALDYTNLPYWDLYAALRLVRLAGADLAEWAAFFAPFGRHDITEQAIREHYKFFVDQAYEKLEDRC